MAVGHIHSVESMGLVDGPGIRCVVFLQGCHLRCQFCHNPDTWSIQGGETIDADSLMKKILRFRPYFECSGGGVTFSGGEPLLQTEFLLEMLKRCRKEGIHTVLDTAGAVEGDFSEILDHVDLILLDIKHPQAKGYRWMTGHRIDFYEDFRRQLREHRVDLWARAVIIPGVNDNEDYIRELWEEVKRLPRVKKIELLPYHTLGVNKYHKMGIAYPLEGVMPMDRKKVARWQEVLNRALMSAEG